MLTALALVVMVGLVGRSRIRPRRIATIGPAEEAQLFSGIVTELQSGASPRGALAAAAARLNRSDLDRMGRLALAGLPFTDIAAALDAAGFASTRVGAALEIVDLTGGRAADVFATLRDRARAMVDLEREKRALTAQVRISAVVVALLPLAMLTFHLLGGTLGRMITSGPAGRAVAATGVVMQVAGSWLVWRISRRAA